MSPKCMVGASKRGKNSKKRFLKKGAGCNFNVMKDNVTGPVSSLKSGVKKFENYVEGLENKVKEFGERMMKKNVPQYNPSQSGGGEVKMIQNFDNYVRNLLSAMEHFKVEVTNISNKSNKKLSKSRKQSGGLKLYQGKNLDLTSAPNHPIWDKSGGKKKKVVKRKVTKKKVSKKSNPKSTTTKR